MTKRAILPPFLEKLALIVQTVEPDVASWSADGKMFVVREQDRFEQVLKQHFKGNAQTFTRQLHFYGFKKLDSSEGEWAFVHEKFQKGQPDLIHDIRRKTRVDPTAENVASHVEVQTLRTQVAFLQDVVEDLRTQLDSVINVLDEAGVAEVERKLDGAPLNLASGTKRPRHSADLKEIYDSVQAPLSRENSLSLFESKDSDLEPIFFKDTDMDSASLGSLSETDINDVADILEESMPRKPEEPEMKLTGELMADLFKTDNLQSSARVEQAVQIVSNATKIDKDSVAKVIQYFRTCCNISPSKSEEEKKTKVPVSEDLSDLVFHLPNLGDAVQFKKIGQIPPLPAQRVGAN